MTLTEEAKELISREFETLSKPIEKTLWELEIYKWVLRVLFVILFGGSIFGVYKLQDYLDGRIVSRNEEYSGLIYGTIAQLSYDPDSAVEMYYSFLNTLNESVYRPNKMIRSIFFTHFITALANANKVDPQGEFEVKSIYSDLINSKWFKKDSPSNDEKWKNDPYFQNALGMCRVKFGDTAEDIDKAQPFFECGEKATKNPIEIAPIIFAKGLLALAKGNDAEAQKWFREAATLSPKIFGTTNLTGSINTDFPAEVEVWTRASRKFGTTEFEQRYKKVINNLTSSMPDSSKTSTPTLQNSQIDEGK